ncbi:MAG TPA: hypothetical protein PKV72_03770 [Candidatus Peribacteria bacterium]|nr:hypothetical protein [Candidatus Peribacteria bacterium]
MRKHAKRRVHTQAAVYQPSDFVSVVAIGITALILVSALFAMERFAGVPVSVHGESASAPSDALLSSVRKPKAAKPSQTATRAAARKSRTPQASSSSSSSQAAVTNPVCSNALCSNLLNPFIEQGDPACMRSQQCVDIVNYAIRQPNCNRDSICITMDRLYDFYYSSQGCVTNFNDACESMAQWIIRRSR